MQGRGSGPFFGNTLEGGGTKNKSHNRGRGLEKSSSMGGLGEAILGFDLKRRGGKKSE